MESKLSFASFGNSNSEGGIVVTSRSEYMAAINAASNELSIRLTAAIEKAMSEARVAGKPTFAVSLDGFPVGTYEDVLRPYRDAGWRVTSSNDRNESMLNFS